MESTLPFEFNYTLRTVSLGAAALGAVSGSLGTFAVLRRQSLVGDAVSHAALPGIMLAFIVMQSKAPLVLVVGAAIAGWIGTIQAMFSNLKLLTAGMDWLVIALHVFGTIAVFAGLALAVWHLSVVLKAPKRWLGKIWAGVLVLATAICVWVAIAYHLVGISTNY
jgi:ABC-type Mn2+/Zn2+ transport system permease subunit